MNNTLQNINKKGQSGFEDVPSGGTWAAACEKPCFDRDHNPPNMMVVPTGKRYRHVCPSCGKVSYINAGMVVRL